jgi:hypothetical protein
VAECDEDRIRITALPKIEKAGGKRGVCRKGEGNEE